MLRTFVGYSKVWLLVYLLSVIAIFVFFVWNQKNLLYRTDWISYYSGSKMAVQNPRRIYDVNYQYHFQERLFSDVSVKSFLPYKNPILVAFLFVPLASLNYTLGYSLFFVINLLILAIIALLLRKFLKLRPSSTLLLLTFFPVFWTLLIAQISMIILLAMLGIFLALKKKEVVLAGVLSALMYSKPQYLLITPFVFLIVRDKSRYLISFFLTLSLLILIEIFILGPGYLSKYLLFLSETDKGFFGTRVSETYSVWPVFLFFKGKLFLSETYLYLTNFGLYALSLAAFALRKDNFGVDQAFSLGVILTVVFSVHALPQDLVFLMIPLSIAIKAGKKKESLFFLSAPLWGALEISGFYGLLLLIFAMNKITYETK